MTSNQPHSAQDVTATTVLGAAFLGIVIATLGLVMTTFSLPAAHIATGPQPCVNGIVPLNPYVVNCNLPSRGNQVIGAAPDAGAIISCRHNLACLALYVNYPGTVLVPGYRS
ncbi:hypothetical protein [Mycolicibacterium helvum]|uniref:Uncharacterized protein n=1 Tax=Mycolicibacterium helvum TaxID=1534349 RepID=A0A7I7THR3_9MYCO|nr:hypothetical protein [Mycolicibacterium helvum]BBY67706.1 hypothetical protein MHEL_59490 [Mycolicibacterium helvum]